MKWYDRLCRKVETGSWWDQPYTRPKFRVVDCNGENPVNMGARLTTELPGHHVMFYTWEEAVIYVNDHSLHIVEEK